MIMSRIYAWLLQAATATALKQPERLARQSWFRGQLIIATAIYRTPRAVLERGTRNGEIHERGFWTKLTASAVS